MPRLKNKGQAPLVVPVKGQGPIYFAPLEIRTVPDEVLADPLIQANIRRGNLQVLPEGPVAVGASEAPVVAKARKKGEGE